MAKEGYRYTTDTRIWDMEMHKSFNLSRLFWGRIKVVGASHRVIA